MLLITSLRVRFKSCTDKREMLSHLYFSKFELGHNVMGINIRDQMIEKKKNNSFWSQQLRRSGKVKYG